MPVPETAVDEERGAPCGKHQVRLARQIAAAEPEARAQLVRRTPHRQLRRGVRGLHRAHHGRAFLGIENVSHRIFRRQQTSGEWMLSLKRSQLRVTHQIL
jgi:hypothetical protein